MNTINRRILAAAYGIVLAVTLPHVRAAESPARPYLAVDAGVELQQDVTIKDTGGAKMSFDPGIRFDFGAGYHFAESWALEFQTGLIYNSVDKIGGISLNAVGASADFYEIPLMANVIYTVPIHERIGIFLGGGIGGVVGLFHTEGFGQSSDNTDLTFGYQALLGAKYAFNDRMEMGIGYKFLGTTDHDLGSGVKSEGTMTHSLLVVFSVNF
jgi:opacity protein-like surface antigen